MKQYLWLQNIYSKHSDAVMPELAPSFRVLAIEDEDTDGKDQFELVLSHDWLASSIVVKKPKLFVQKVGDEEVEALTERFSGK